MRLSVLSHPAFEGYSVQFIAVSYSYLVICDIFSSEGQRLCVHRILCLCVILQGRHKRVAPRCPVNRQRPVVDFVMEHACCASCNVMQVPQAQLQPQLGMGGGACGHVFCLCAPSLCKGLLKFFQQETVAAIQRFAEVKADR